MRRLAWLAVGAMLFGTYNSYAAPTEMERQHIHGPCYNYMKAVEDYRMYYDLASACRREVNSSKCEERGILTPEACADKHTYCNYAYGRKTQAYLEHVRLLEVTCAKYSRLDQVCELPNEAP